MANLVLYLLFISYFLIPVEKEGGVNSTSFTDMASTMKVTREATNALYSEQSMHQLDQAQYLSRKYYIVTCFLVPFFLRQLDKKCVFLLMLCGL